LPTLDVQKPETPPFAFSELKLDTTDVENCNDLIFFFFMIKIFVCDT